MRIGTRWAADAPPPPSVPEALAAAIAATGLRSGSWTLTWLEGRAVADHSGGTHLEVAPSGTVTGEDELFAEDNDWLS
ncbi:hypothetical protein [uncultured Gulosibacter sp.]|uniref:hypothetical protein n=1 Tax=uncultured Gulosibacter sp. TaxID=1339167 RepID=UPI00288B1299|nr:hypothetical protein [uncultured Gulosibacter sp.]